MLKIKDNVDLKELEKFGFQSIKSGFEWVKGSDYNIMYSIDTSRIINIGTPLPMLEQLDDTIYDLIKADLVEKVEE